MAINPPLPARQRPARYSGKYEVLGDIELPAEEAAAAEFHIAQAESERSEAHVTLRWGRVQLDIVRRAARLAGVPYQTYLKQATMQRAIEDLRVARTAGLLDARGEILDLAAPNQGMPTAAADLSDVQALKPRPIESTGVVLEAKIQAVKRELLDAITAKNQPRVTELKRILQALEAKQTPTPPPTTY